LCLNFGLVKVNMYLYLDKKSSMETAPSRISSFVPNLAPDVETETNVSFLIIFFHIAVLDSKKLFNNRCLPGAALRGRP